MQDVDAPGSSVGRSVKSLHSAGPLPMRSLRLVPDILGKTPARRWQLTLSLSYCHSDDRDVAQYIVGRLATGPPGLFDVVPNGPRSEVSSPGASRVSLNGSIRRELQFVRAGATALGTSRELRITRSKTITPNASRNRRVGRHQSPGSPA